MEGECEEEMRGEKGGSERFADRKVRDVEEG